jgi:hypothetical protein
MQFRATKKVYIILTTIPVSIAASAEEYVLMAESLTRMENLASWSNVPNGANRNSIRKHACPAIFASRIVRYHALPCENPWTEKTYTGTHILKMRRPA